MASILVIVSAFARFAARAHVSGITDEAVSASMKSLWEKIDGLPTHRSRWR